MSVSIQEVVTKARELFPGVEVTTRVDNGYTVVSVIRRFEIAFRAEDTSLDDVTEGLRLASSR